MSPNPTRSDALAAACVRILTACLLASPLLALFR